MKTKKLLTKIGQNYNNFKLKLIKPIKEINVTYREIQHIKSGAQIIHIEADDVENVFSLSFKTHPSSSNGVAHILEHTVLCGSEKYPVRDPFFSMTRRSLNTFMNAMTGSDFTCYPAASCVKKDFFNLLDVYMDAVFHPLLTELSFLQEGHRLEYGTEKSKKMALEFKGIVFNEMKGAMNSGMSRLWQQIYKALYPNLTYRHNSGGEPLSIPDLTYKNLIDFHKKFYHPSQCLFFFYGDTPLEETLDFLDKSTLSTASKQAPIPPLPRQKRFSVPKRIKDFFPSTKKDPNENLFSVSMLACPVGKQLDLLCLQVLSIALMSHDASPLKKELLASNLCSEAFLSIDDEVSEVPISFIFKGVLEKNNLKLENLLFNSIKKIGNEGIPNTSLDLALHQMEFSRLEILKDDSPHGLNLFFRTCLLKQHKGDPVESLSLHSLFKDLRKKIKDKLYVKKILNKYIISNKHRASISLLPNPKLEEKELKAEHALLKKLEKGITKEKKLQIKKNAKQLTSLQEKEENLDVLPKASLKDVSSTPKSYSLKKERKNLYLRKTFTNKILYSTLLLDLPNFKAEEASLIKLFTNFLPEMGWGNRKYSQHLNYIQSHLGNLSTTSPVFTLDDNPNKLYPTLCLYSKCLDRNTKYLFSLLEDFFQHVDFNDFARIKELLKQHYTSLHSSIGQRAMGYSTRQSSSSCSKLDQLSNLYGGLPYYLTIKGLYDDFDNQVESLAQFFSKIKNSLTDNWTGSMVYTADGQMLDKIKRTKYLNSFKPKVADSKGKISKLNKNQVQRDAYVIASSVAFTSYSFPTITYQHKDSVYLSLASQLFDNLTLHKRIREQGGAYGSGSRYSPNTGTFSFHAYRDPHLFKTLCAFEESVENISKKRFTDAELEEAKLGILQGWDAPLSPGSEGSFEMSLLISGKTLKDRKERRARLLAATSSDIQKAVRKHIESSFHKGSLVSFANESFFKQKNAELKKAKQEILNLRNI
ncbi:Presequence protease, mitochondrial [Chlamydiales bacterium SCGC AB-751-O23]|jgi:presequence protease|nr:Presequence protease, mitochondrial [Chlamydiales bacterium SCGC AB-751-O23]